MNRNNLEAYNCSLLQAGQLLRVPTVDACVERAGAWDCYDVQQGDTLADLSTEKSGKLLINSAYLASFNERALWGASYGDTLFAGQQLKLPRYHCEPTPCDGPSARLHPRRRRPHEDTRRAALGRPSAVAVPRYVDGFR